MKLNHHRATMPAVLASSIALALGMSLPVHAQYHYPAPASSSGQHMVNSIHPIRARSPESPAGAQDRFGQNPNPSMRPGEAMPRTPANQTHGTNAVIYGAVPPDPDAVPGEPPVVGGHRGRNGTSTGAMGEAGYAHTSNSTPRRANSLHGQLNPSVEGYRYGETPVPAQPARGRTPANAMHTLQTGGAVRARAPVNANLRQPVGTTSSYGPGNQRGGNENGDGQQQGYGDTGAQASHGRGNHHGGHGGNGQHGANGNRNGGSGSSLNAGEQGYGAGDDRNGGDSNAAHPNGGHHNEGAGYGNHAGHGGNNQHGNQSNDPGNGGGNHHGGHGNHAGQTNDHHGGQTTFGSGQTGTTPGSSPSGQQPHGIGAVPTVHANGSIDPGYARAQPTAPPTTSPAHVHGPTLTRIPQANPTQSQHGSHPNVPLQSNVPMTSLAPHQQLQTSPPATPAQATLAHLPTGAHQGVPMQSNVPMTSLAPRQQLQTPPPATPAQATPAHLPTGAHQGVPMQSNVTMPAPRQRVQLPSPVPASSAGHSVPTGVQYVPVSPVNPNILIKPKAKVLGVQHLQQNSTLGAPTGGGD